MWPWHWINLSHPCHLDKRPKNRMEAFNMILEQPVIWQKLTGDVAWGWLGGTPSWQLVILATSPNFNLVFNVALASISLSHPCQKVQDWHASDFRYTLKRVEKWWLYKRTGHRKAHWRNLYRSTTFVRGRFLGIISEDPSVSKINWCHGDIFRFFFTKLLNILYIPLHGSVSFLRSWMWTGYFLNSTGFICN